jgi:hypothetical protein
MLQVTVSTFRRFSVDRRISDSAPNRRGGLRRLSVAFEKATWSDRRKLVAHDPSGESATNSTAYLPISAVARGPIGVDGHSAAVDQPNCCRLWTICA